MSYRSVMVYVEADAAPEQLLQVAVNLADRFGAALLGVSALAIVPPAVAAGVVMSGPGGSDIELLQETLAERGGWFRRLAGGDSRKLEWRSALDFPVEVVTREARGADLVVIGQKMGPGSAYRSLDPGGAILRMGRPTLVVPDGVSALQAERVVIGWKDTREARLAVRDALPFLQQAARVTIVEACGPDDANTATGRLEDVARYLAHHRVQGGPKVMLQQEGSGAEQLLRVAREERADLLVTGAYGHSRFGEWIFGGMTRELLAKSPFCCLMSH